MKGDVAALALAVHALFVEEDSFLATVQEVASVIQR
jgi:hypothetical protein